MEIEERLKEIQSQIEINIKALECANTEDINGLATANKLLMKEFMELLGLLLNNN